MAKVNISLPDEALRLIDQEAERRHISRSEYIRLATETYAGFTNVEEANSKILAERREACKRIDELREQITEILGPDFDPLEELRKLRATRWA